MYIQKYDPATAAAAGYGMPIQQESPEKLQATADSFASTLRDAYERGDIVNLNQEEGDADFVNPLDNIDWDNLTVTVSIPEPSQSLEVQLNPIYYQTGAMEAFLQQEAAKEGQAIHGFLYLDTEFFQTAAEKLANNEVTGVGSLDQYAEITLDFFTGGNYTQADVNKLKADYNNVILEMEEMLKTTGEINLDDLKTTLSIAGTTTTMGELEDFREVALELGVAMRFSESLQGEATLGMAMSMAEYYAQDKGELGEMFLSGMTEIYDRAVNKIEKEVSDLNTNSYYPPVSQAYVDTVKDKHESFTPIRESFDSLDTTNKQSMEESFKDALKEANDIWSDFGSKYHDTVTMRNASNTAALMKMFDKWMDMVS